MEEAEERFEDATTTALSAITEAFEDLAEVVEDDTEEEELRVDTFCQACSLVSVLFGCLGLAFKFAELEYFSKVSFLFRSLVYIFSGSECNVKSWFITQVRDLMEASKTFETLREILDLDVANDTVKVSGSHSRNLRRLRQGLDLIRVLFEQFLSTE